MKKIRKMQSYITTHITGDDGDDFDTEIIYQDDYHYMNDTSDDDCPAHKYYVDECHERDDKKDYDDSIE